MDSDCDSNSHLDCKESDNVKSSVCKNQSTTPNNLIPSSPGAAMVGMTTRVHNPDLHNHPGYASVLHPHHHHQQAAGIIHPAHAHPAYYQSPHSQHHHPHPGHFAVAMETAAGGGGCPPTIFNNGVDTACSPYTNTLAAAAVVAGISTAPMLPAYSVAHQAITMGNPCLSNNPAKLSPHGQGESDVASSSSTPDNSSGVGYFSTAPNVEVYSAAEIDVYNMAQHSNLQASMPTSIDMSNYAAEFGHHPHQQAYHSHPSNHRSLTEHVGLANHPTMFHHYPSYAN